MSEIEIIIWPRKTVTWEWFCQNTPPNSIALDGLIWDVGPCWDEEGLHLNFDHHNMVERESTMSTAMQVMFAIKGDMFNRLGRPIRIYINDPDQDTTFAVWLLLKHKQFESTHSHPNINRLLTLNDRLDITGGAYPMNLDDQLVRQHNWVFGHYSALRKSGDLATASETVMRNTLEADLRNLDQFFIGGRVEELELDTRHEILYKSPRFGYTIVDEIGGNSARYYLFSKGLLDGYVSLVARRPDGRYVYAVGRKNRYTKFPLPKFYPALNAAEPKFSNRAMRWGGSNIVGGSDRDFGSIFAPQELPAVLDSILEAP